MAHSSKQIWIKVVGVSRKENGAELAIEVGQSFCFRAFMYFVNEEVEFIHIKNEVAATIIAYLRIQRPLVPYVKEFLSAHPKPLPWQLCTQSTKEVASVLSYVETGKIRHLHIF